MYILNSPAIYSLEITSACNNRCPGCSNIYASDRNECSMLLEKWEEIIAGIGGNAIQIRVTGGEPTLHPNFLEILKLATSFNAWVTVFTNGRWAYPADFVKKIRDLPHFSGLLISLHGATPESHEAFTKVKGSFNQTLRNIRLAREHGIRVALSTILTRKSVEELDLLLPIAKELGVQHIAFNRFLGQPISEIEPSKQQLLAVTRRIEAMIKAGEPVKYGIGMPQCFEVNSSEGCLAGVAYAAIDPWGNVRPCAHATTVVGSLHEYNLHDLWHGPKMQAWRELMPGECTACAAYSACHGGCRAMAEVRADHKDPLRGEPLKTFSSHPRQLTLPSRGKPISKALLREEAFGYSMFYNGQMMIVRKEARTVIDACNGQLSCAELAEKFGQSGLNLLGEMWSKGFLVMQ